MCVVGQTNLRVFVTFAAYLGAALGAGADAQEPSTAAVASPAAPVLLGRLLKVVDGDSLEVQLDSGLVRVRLDSIDAPEYDQPGGAEAGAKLTELLATSETLLLDVVTQDSYERLVSRVIVPKADGSELRVNEEMAKSGHAWAYRRYAKDINYCRWEGAAREAKLGLWARDPKEWTYPPDFRRVKRKEIEQAPDMSGETIERCVASVEAAQAERR